MSVVRLAFLTTFFVTGVALHASPGVDFDQVIRFPVEKYQLKNGLTVLLHQDSSIPSVSVQQWFRVGSKDEFVGRTGLAHFFEHMMFKGTPKFPKDTWGKFLNSRGADTNAFTSFDYTGYYINGPSDHVELFLEIEADRMRNLLLDPKEVASEREVVKEERRMRYENSIEGGIREKMAELMFSSLAYRWLPIGSMADLNAASMDDLHRFYKSFYSPNNAVLVIAGHFDAARVKGAISKYFDRLPREEIVRPEIKPESNQTQVRRATITREAQAPTIAIAYRLPDMTHPDHYALDILSIAIGQGQSSRLHRDLVYQRQLALAVSSYSWGGSLAGDFYFTVNLKPNANPESVIQAVEAEVAKVRNRPITAKELDKARNILMKGYVDGLKRVSGRARMLASYEIQFNDYTRLFSDLAKYRQVTARDVQRVAQKYLQPNSRNIVIVNPAKSRGAP